jgi:hypothetical protein
MSSLTHLDQPTRAEHCPIAHSKDLQYCCQFAFDFWKEKKKRIKPIPPTKAMS